jgi:hypothetical protein
VSWVVIDLESLLDQSGPEGSMPVMGALDAVQLLLSQGHRVTAYTSRFAMMPAARRQTEKEAIDQELQASGFPPELEVWSGWDKPAADAFIGEKNINLDKDWPLALSQLQLMLPPIQEAELAEPPPEIG